MELLRIATAGSVDDGKSTLIGRLLYDSKAIYEDVLMSAERVSRRQRSESVNLALLTDGLRAEREQGITIDVAYRYFDTPRRKFILADTPGHVQYTRNMVTGASTADAALIIVDARHGVVEQSRRHAVIAALLGIRHFIVCVNKMDLVGYSRDVFDPIEQEFKKLLDGLNVRGARFIPVSALDGDNVVDASPRMPWYTGVPLLQCLEGLDTSEGDGNRPLRLPVQYVIRPLRDEFHDQRAYAGSVACGAVRLGQEVVILPSGITTRVTAIETPDGQVEHASGPVAVSVQVADDIDISRGDMIAAADGAPRLTREFDATVCWMSDSTALRPGAMLRIKHTTRHTRAMVAALDYRLDVNTLCARSDVAALKLNEIGRVSIRTSAPIACDDYTYNRVTGSFILIDESTDETVAAGMIGDPGFSICP